MPSPFVPRFQLMLVHVYLETSPTELLSAGFIIYIYCCCSSVIL